MRDRFSSGMTLAWWHRVLLALWSLFLIAGFAFAFSLVPDRRGFGTHQQLGLPPCSFRTMFGIFCPTCGGTTCFSHFVRGQWWLAIKANPAVFLLALFCADMIPWSWISIVKKRAVGFDDPATFVAWGLVVFCTLALLQWGWRLALT